MSNYASMTIDELKQLIAKQDNEAFEELVHRFRRMTHDQLMKLIAGQDEKAFEELDRRLKDRLPALIQRSFSQTVDNAQDVYQEVLLRIWRKADLYDDRRQFFAWILTIARNVILDFKRKKRLPIQAGDNDLIVDTVPDGPGLSVETKTFVDESFRRLRDGIERLPKRERDAIWKLYIESKTYEEVAKEMGLTIEAVRGAESRGLKKLWWDLGTGFDPGLCR